MTGPHPGQTFRAESSPVGRPCRRRGWLHPSRHPAAAGVSARIEHAGSGSVEVPWWSAREGESAGRPRDPRISSAHDRRGRLGHDGVVGDHPPSRGGARSAPWAGGAATRRPASDAPTGPGGRRRRPPPPRPRSPRPPRRPGMAPPPSRRSSAGRRRSSFGAVASRPPRGRSSTLRRGWRRGPDGPPNGPRRCLDAARTPDADRSSSRSTGPRVLGRLGGSSATGSLGYRAGRPSVIGRDVHPSAGLRRTADGARAAPSGCSRRSGRGDELGGQILRRERPPAPLARRRSERSQPTGRDVTGRHTLRSRVDGRWPAVAAARGRVREMAPRRPVAVVRRGRGRRAPPGGAASSEDGCACWWSSRIRGSGRCWSRPWSGMATRS